MPKNVTSRPQTKFSRIDEDQWSGIRISIVSAPGHGRGRSQSDARRKPQLRVVIRPAPAELISQTL
jgi:hypothetical protein